jgi:hypothetical protein
MKKELLADNQSSNTSSNQIENDSISNSSSVGQYQHVSFSSSPPPLPPMPSNFSVTITQQQQASNQLKLSPTFQTGSNNSAATNSNQQQPPPLPPWPPNLLSKYQLSKALAGIEVNTNNESLASTKQAQTTVSGDETSSAHSNDKKLKRMSVAGTSNEIDAFLRDYMNSTQIDTPSEISSGEAYASPNSLLDSTTSTTAQATQNINSSLAILSSLQANQPGSSSSSTGATTPCDVGGSLAANVGGGLLSIDARHTNDERSASFIDTKCIYLLENKTLYYFVYLI